MQPSPPDIVLWYAELGYPYLPLIERMTESARRVMPESRLVLITPTPSSGLGKYFDKVIDTSAKQKANIKTLCYDRASAMVSWQLLTERRTIYVDPDIEFKRPISFDGTFDVGLLWRGRKPDQPVNTGIILAEPGIREFWVQYGAVIANLPEPIRGWWCDQLAFGIITGKLHSAGDIFQAYDARLKLFDWKHACAPAEKASEDAWAIHYKGTRKWAYEAA